MLKETKNPNVCPIVYVDDDKGKYSLSTKVIAQSSTAIS